MGKHTLEHIKYNGNEVYVEVSNRDKLGNVLDEVYQRAEFKSSQAVSITLQFDYQNDIFDRSLYSSSISSTDELISKLLSLSANKKCNLYCYFVASGTNFEFSGYSTIVNQNKIQFEDTLSFCSIIIDIKNIKINIIVDKDDVNSLDMFTGTIYITSVEKDNL